METREVFWLYQNFVFDSLQRFMKEHRIMDSDHLIVKNSLEQITEDVQNNKYDVNYGIHSFWQFAATVSDIKEEFSTDKRSGCLQSAISYLEEALKSKFCDSENGAAVIKKDLLKVKVETTLQLILPLFKTNKSEARIMFNKYRESLPDYQQDGIKCVLLGLQDPDTSFCSFTEYINIVAIAVQNMLNNVEVPFLERVSTICYKKLDPVSSEYQRLVDIYELESDVESNLNVTNEEFMFSKRNIDTLTRKHDSDSNPKPLPKVGGNKQSHSLSIHTISGKDSRNNVFAKPNEEITNDTIKIKPTLLTKHCSNQYAASFAGSISYRATTLKRHTDSVPCHRNRSVTSSVMSYASRQKRKFNPLLDTYIIMGMQRFGQHKDKWKKTLEMFPFPPYRTATHLKDRWRTLMNTNEVTIVHNEIKISNKYVAILKHVETKLKRHGLNENNRKVTEYLSDNQSAVSHELNYLSPEDISDVESSTSLNHNDMNCVKDWLDTGTVQNKIGRKAPPLFRTEKKNGEFVIPAAAREATSKTRNVKFQKKNFQIERNKTDVQDSVQSASLEHSGIHVPNMKKRRGKSRKNIGEISDLKKKIVEKINPVISNLDSDRQNVSNVGIGCNQYVQSEEKVTSEGKHASSNTHHVGNNKLTQYCGNAAYSNIALEPNGTGMSIDKENACDLVQEILSNHQENILHSEVVDSEMTIVNNSVDTGDSGTSGTGNMQLNSDDSAAADIISANTNLHHSQCSTNKTLKVKQTEVTIKHSTNSDEFTPASLYQSRCAPINISKHPEIPAEERMDMNLSTPFRSSTQNFDANKRRATSVSTSPSISEYITADEGSIPVETSEEKSLAKISGSISDETLVEDRNNSIQMSDADTPKNIEERLENNYSSQCSGTGTLDLLDGIMNTQAGCADSSQCNDIFPETFEVKKEKSDNIKTELVVSEAKYTDPNTVTDKLLAPPPNEIEVKGRDISCSKTPVLILNKVKLEPGVFSADVCILVNDCDSSQQNSNRDVSVKLSKEDKLLFANEPGHVLPATRKVTRGRRKVWTREEDDNLLNGVEKYGEGSWKLIFDEYRFHNRTPINRRLHLFLHKN